MEHRDGSSRFPAYISVSFFSRHGVRVTDESRRWLLLPRGFITRGARAVRVGRLDGRVALVTGGSGGIGKASVLEFASEGADVAVQFNRGREAAQAVVEKVQGLGRKAVAPSRRDRSPIVPDPCRADDWFPRAHRRRGMLRG